MTTVLMPKLSDSMESGTIISWFKQTGDHVEVGDELLEIETDKSTAPYAAEAAGELEILVELGATVAVGQPVARIMDAAGTAAGPQRPDSGAAQTPVLADDVPRADEAPPAAPVPSRNGADPQAAPRATPLARRIAADAGISLQELRGTGPLGRITRADVLAHPKAAGLAQMAQPRLRPHAPVSVSASVPAAAATGAAEPALAGTDAPGAVATGPGARRQEPSRLQQLIARRMAEAKATIPHFQVQTEVDMGATLELRAQLKAYAAEARPVPSLNDMIVKASALALREHPLANGSYRDGGFELHDEINVGIAVAAADALVVPVIRRADEKSLGAIAIEARELAARVRDGSATPAQLAGGTFTVSNLGMFGMTAITPVINPPQAAILGVGALRPTLARQDGEIIERQLLTLTLSCDHRILYGADAARFLAGIRELLETPLRFAL